MPDVAVTTGQVDGRPFTPAVLQAVDSSLSVADARVRADEAATMIQQQRRGAPIGRERVTCRVATDGERLLLSRWPCEDDAPAVLWRPSTSVTGTAIATSTYRVVGEVRQALYRRDGWGYTVAARVGMALTAIAAAPLVDWEVGPYWAGWLMPGQVSTWASSTTYPATVGSTSYDDPATSLPYTVGSWVRSTDPRVLLRFECTTAGTSGVTLPAGFATAVAGDTMTDDSVTWTAASATELPADLSEAALRLALHLHRARDRDPSVKARSAPGGVLVTYRANPQSVPDELGESLRGFA